MLADALPLRVEWRKPRPEWPGDADRYSIQRRYVTFDVRPTDRVLDIGSGDYPFPLATVLADRYLTPSEHRHGSIVRDGKPLVIADVAWLPFRDKAFDFVYCSHVLEHVDDPVRACAELMRVGKRGFIETPTMGKDVLFAWAREMHKWHVVACGPNLCFFEYSPRQLEGIRSSIWRDLVLSRWYHPLQKGFYENQDIFNVMFSWVGAFSVFVFRVCGMVESSNSTVTSRGPSFDERE